LMVKSVKSLFFTTSLIFFDDELIKTKPFCTPFSLEAPGASWVQPLVPRHCGTVPGRRRAKGRPWDRHRWYCKRYYNRRVVPSGKQTVCYWKLSFIVELPSYKMVIFYSYVSLPEGKCPMAWWFCCHHQKKYFLEMKYDEISPSQLGDVKH
jgi:hypothetical protein